VRFLADESCDFAVVRALRAAGHDVMSIMEVARGAKDLYVIDLARRERRVLLTEDKDFGQLVYADGRGDGGVVLIRFTARARGHLQAATVDLVARFGARLPSSFVVLEPGRVRIGSLPSTEGGGPHPSE
jgi:predicted nuclease of predicted toxin-antitoxin system